MFRPNQNIDLIKINPKAKSKNVIQELTINLIFPLLSNIFFCSAEIVLRYTHLFII